MNFQKLVAEELNRARQHNPYNSVHEGFAVLFEEVDEVWDEVRKKRRNRSKKALLKELVQVAAVAQKMAEDCAQ
jgi:NTP pyrophosphatase (non-canonical NTP hydrolase)